MEDNQKNPNQISLNNFSVEYKKDLHPFQFAVLLIVVVLLITLGTRFFARHYQEQHRFHLSVAELQKSPWTTILIKRGDNLFSLFKRAGIPEEDYKKIILLKETEDIFKQIKPGEAFYFLIDQEKVLQELVYHYSPIEYLIITREKDEKKQPTWTAHIVKQTVGKKFELAKGLIRNSLAKSAEVAGLPPRLLYQLTDIFNWEIDFRRDVQAGDQFRVLYEVYYSEHEKIKTGDIVAAEFINQKRKYVAIRYKDKNGTINYYTPDGNNLKKAFLRAPVKYSRISSPFNAARYHPILHVVRPHEGVDLVAPTGTPIKAAGYGRIEFRGRKGGYGKAMIIYHNREYTTLYAHMSRFQPGLHVGSRVYQGQIIGYVGQTGLATGPHLHYEFHVYGVPHDPMKVKLPQASPIAKSERSDFLFYAKEMMKDLDS